MKSARVCQMLRQQGSPCCISKLLWDCRSHLSKSRCRVQAMPGGSLSLFFLIRYNIRKSNGYLTTLACVSSHMWQENFRRVGLFSFSPAPAVKILWMNHKPIEHIVGWPATLKSNFNITSCTLQSMNFYWGICSFGFLRVGKSITFLKI